LIEALDILIVVELLLGWRLLVKWDYNTGKATHYLTGSPETRGGAGRGGVADI
jgi:hypothetical protein